MQALSAVSPGLNVAAGSRLPAKAGRGVCTLSYLAEEFRLQRASWRAHCRIYGLTHHATRWCESALKVYAANLIGAGCDPYKPELELF